MIASTKIDLHRGEWSTLGTDVGPGHIATWGVVTKDEAVGFDSHEYRGGSSEHVLFGWRPW